MCASASINWRSRCRHLAAMLAAAATGATLPASIVHAVPREVTELALRVGEQQVLSSQGVRSYSEGTRGVVDVRLTRDASQFVLVGLQPGTTTLLLIMLDGRERHYRIHVTDPQDSGEADEETVAVKVRDNIRLDFYFVQLDSRYQHQLGISWPGTLGGGQISARADLLGGSLESATAVVAEQALPRLDMAQTDGWAKILRQAAVVTANGSRASFAGGGEVNIPIQGSLAAEIRAIEFGSRIEVLPRYDARSGRIELQIRAEVADLSDDGGTGAPGRTTSTLDTRVNLELGQSLVLAGLSARSEAHGRSGMPVLSRIPLLGPLFGSDSNRAQRSESLVFIVPSVVDAVSLEAREHIREALELYQAYDGDLQDTPLRAADPAYQGEGAPP